MAGLEARESWLIQAGAISSIDHGNLQVKLRMVYLIDLIQFARLVASKQLS